VKSSFYCWPAKHDITWCILPLIGSLGQDLISSFELDITCCSNAIDIHVGAFLAVNITWEAKLFEPVMKI
jgi:hypothetical protein